MSKELKTLKGKIKIPDEETRKSYYKETDILLTSFYGGVKRGHSLQIAFKDENDYYKHFQLDNENLKLLVKEIKKHF
jgi:hypothetical protein